MIYSKVRGIVVVCGIAALLLAVPAQSQGGPLLDWLFGPRCDWVVARAACATPYVADACAPAYTSLCAPCAPQTCSYVPQTCYRTVFRPVPVVTCRVVTRWPLLSPYPVTYFRPVRRWLPQAHLVPYTTHRLVYSDPCIPCVTYRPSVVCDPCAWGVCGPAACPTTSICPPGTCGAGTGSAVPYSPAPTSATVPALNAEPAPKTFQQESKPRVKSLEPIPNANTKSDSSAVPKLIDPDNRTTSLPVRPRVHYRLTASPARPAAAGNDGGWRASRD